LLILRFGGVGKRGGLSRSSNKQDHANVRRSCDAVTESRYLSP